MIEWAPPPHAALNEVLFKTWAYDGGLDCNDAFALSGEPVAPQMVGLFDQGLPQFTASQIAANNVAQRELKKEYLDYWNSTASKTSTGKPVDAVISPAAPFAAARPRMYAYYGYSTWVNLLDYTSVVVPVTDVKAELDPVDVDYKPLNAEDKICYESCESILLLAFV